MTSTEQTTSIDQISWPAPVWAARHEDREGGIAYSYIPPSVPLQETDLMAEDAEPIKIELSAVDFLHVANGQVTVDRNPPEILVGDMRLTIPEAQKLVDAVAEVLARIGLAARGAL